jgi:hypothetical protein
VDSPDRLVSAPGSGPADQQSAAAGLIRDSGAVLRLPVAGGSMRPTLHSGGRVRVRCGLPLRRGDLIVAQAADALVVHRVVGRRAGRLLLRGDDTPRSDPPLDPAAVIGTVVAVEGLAGRRLDGRSDHFVDSLTAGYARAQALLGERPARPRPCAIPRLAEAIRGRVSAPMRPEEELLLLLARVRPDEAAASAAQAVIAGGLQWERLLMLARLGQLGPLVYRGLARLRSPEVPPEVLVALQGQYAGNVMRSRQIDDLLRQMLARLEPTGIRMLAHKGVALAYGVYDEPALRIVGDLDLSVPDADRARAEAAVASIRRDLVLANPDRRSQHGHHVELDGTAHHDMDLTRHGADRWQASELDWPGIWARAVPLTIGSYGLLVPCPTDLLLTLVANAVRRGFSPVRQVADIAATVERHGPELDWSGLSLELARTRLDRRSWIALGLAADWFGAELPPRLLEPPGDLRLAAWERALLARKHRQPFLRLPTRVLWAGSNRAALFAAWGLWRAGRHK